MPRSTGWLRDQPHQRPKLAYSAPRWTLLSGLARESDFSVYDDGTANQGQLGACVFVSLVKALQNWCRAHGQPETLASALFLYFWTRFRSWCAVQGIASPGPSDVTAFVQQDSDTGASHSDACDALVQVGICPETAWTYDDANTGSVADKFRTRPGAEAERLAFDQRTGLVRMSIDDESDDAKIVNLVHALTNKQPVGIGVDVSNDFVNENFDPNVPVGPCDPAQIAGGHALYLVGHRTADDNSRAYKVHMSWGPGAFAYVWFAEKYVLAPSTQLTIIQAAPSFPGGAS
jgi:hypothetical protein